eukprot:s1870_g12.t1
MLKAPAKPLSRHCQIGGQSGQKFNFAALLCKLVSVAVAPAESASRTDRGLRGPGQERHRCGGQKNCGSLAKKRCSGIGFSICVPILWAPVKSMGVFGRKKAENERKVSKWVESAARGSIWGGHNADEIDSINTLGGVVSALALSFVLGLQYMVAPGTDEMQYADFRSMICKSQEFRNYVIDVFKTEDIGKHSEEYFNFTKMIRLNTYMDIEQFLRTEVSARYGEAEGPQKHIACISDKDLQTAVAFMAAEFPMEYLCAFVLQTGDAYRWSKVSENIGGMSGALIFASLLWSIILNLSLALAPVREDASGTALVAWLMVGGPTMFVNYLFLVVGLIAFFFTHGRMLVASSPFAGATIRNTVDISLFSILLPVFVIGVVLGIGATIWSARNSKEEVAKEAETELTGVSADGEGGDVDAVPIQIEQLKPPEKAREKEESIADVKETRM